MTRNKKKFKINKYFELRLEKNKSIIYVKGKKFRQCKYLLLSTPLENMDSLEELGSLDEIADTLDNSLEMSPYKKTSSPIPPKVEFWGHCSNLQVWYENGYDTEILHSNLAFPLLKALTDAGDPQAQRVFAEEIAKRLDSEYLPVMTYLIVNGYLSYLTHEQIKSLNFIDKMIKPDLNRLDNMLTSESFIEDFIFEKIPKTEAEYISKLELLKRYKMRKMVLTFSSSSSPVVETTEQIDKCFENAMKTFPNSDKLILFYISDLRENGHYPEAIDQLKKLIEKFPEKYFDPFKEVNTLNKDEVKKRYCCPDCASVCTFGREYTDSFDAVIGFLCPQCSKVFTYFVNRNS